jgi:rod shape-determining protein MreC
MYQRRRTRILIGILLFAALVLITMDVRAGDGGVLDGLRGTATGVLQPVQDGASALVRPLGSATDGIRELFSLRSENAELRDRVEDLEERRRVVSDLERENREFQALLDLEERLEFETVAARTVALAPSSFEWTITIDAGSDDGIERDMPVIAGAGLVGRVIQVTPTASRVLLAIDPSFSATARSSRTAEIGSVSGRGSDPMLMQPLEPAADIQAGDEIVTSSFAGGVFPGGIPIGVVADAGDPIARLTRSITVLPYVDFTRVHHVLVVLSAPVEPVPPLEGTPGIPFEPPPIAPDGEDGAPTDEDGDDPEPEGAPTGPGQDEPEDLGAADPGSTP